MAEPKTKPTDASVAEFLAQVEDERRRADCETLVSLFEDVTGERAVMWGTSIIGFGKYRYKYNSGRSGEWMLQGFSPRKSDITLYLMPGFGQMGELLDQLGKYKTGKSCLYIKRLSDVDQNVLRKMLERSLELMSPHRVSE